MSSLIESESLATKAVGSGQGGMGRKTVAWRGQGCAGSGGCHAVERVW
ncbi:MAG TPA: hypothetical protein PLJ27_00990 [Polyangiaceae bacterium]|nr:hypothetical protein [Polyangiaceae bacterium]HNZ23579.1 hypothetical protein [Polyangiaceae bacterium]HOD22723.1 hypothetical protein [Polyangiaceae bacterium]HOE47726.1 hypothetical protein [Polyangiaceae bacterium]HOH01351.1 hypothetical protein [Polyangiaceae bacterium]